MQVFLSYASEDRELAEEIQLALVGAEHEVFFDKASLPPGGDYHSRIQSAVERSNAFVFLISPNSVAPGSYAMTELKFARVKWPHPKDKLVPVRLHNTPWETIPAYLRSVTILEPEGNTAAEVAVAVARLGAQSASSEPGAMTVEHRKRTFDDRKLPGDRNGHSAQIWVAIIGLIGVLGTAIIANWGNIFPAKQTPYVPAITKEEASARPEGTGMKGADGGEANSPNLNSDCPEITIWDYSKFPMESHKVKQCEPQ